EQDSARCCIDAPDATSHKNLRPQPPRLLERAACQLVARHSAGETEIVLDARGGPSLTARGLPLDNQRPQPFRGSVDRRSEAGGAPADDHGIVFRETRPNLQAEES